GGKWGRGGLDARGNGARVPTDGVDQLRSHNAQNQVTALTGGTVPAYDANGNTTRDDRNVTFVYDAWNRLVQAGWGNGGAGFAYDALGRRVREGNRGPPPEFAYSQH